MIESRYIVQDAIGEGGSGSVFRAWDTQLGRYVAIKRIRKDATITAKLEKEAAILASLNHPNIVTIHDFDLDEQGPFVVMELVEGRTLDEIVEARPLRLPGFLELVNQVCRGLFAAHAQKLFHQDIKPGNLMVHFHDDKSFTVKILDFGLTAVAGETEDGIVLASIWTVSPEHLAHRPIDARSDIYSLGCVFYYALTGKYPHDGSVEAIIMAHLQNDPVSPHLLRPDIPAALSAVVLKMLARDPADRPQTADDVRKEIVAAARPSTAPLPVQKRKSPLPALSIAVAGLALTVGVAWFLTHRNPQASASPIEIPAATPAPQVSTRVDPFDALSFPAANGLAVVTEGTPVSMTESRLLETRNLAFAADEKHTLTLAFPSANFSAEQVGRYIGKRVRATGLMSERLGSYRITIKDPSSIETLQ